jgi:hypothetical protein
MYGLLVRRGLSATIMVVSVAVVSTTSRAHVSESTPSHVEYQIVPSLDDDPVLGWSIEGVGGRLHLSVAAFDKKLEASLTSVSVMTSDCIAEEYGASGIVEHDCEDYQTYYGHLVDDATAVVTLTKSGNDFLADIYTSSEVLSIERPTVSELEAPSDSLVVARRPRTHSERAGAAAGSSFTVNAYYGNKDRLTTVVVGSVGFSSQVGGTWNGPRFNSRAPIVMVHSILNMNYHLLLGLPAGNNAVVSVRRVLWGNSDDGQPVPLPVQWTPSISTTAGLARSTMQYHQTRSGSHPLSMAHLFVEKIQGAHGLIGPDHPASLCAPISGVAISYNLNPQTIYRTVMHETLHLMGATHDQDTADCSGTGHVMSSSDNLSFTMSECTKNAVINYKNGAASNCYRYVLCGDANGDGTINAADALLTLQSAIDLTPRRPLMDVANPRDRITASDSLMILRMAIGLPGPEDCDAGH